MLAAVTIPAPEDGLSEEVLVCFEHDRHTLFYKRELFFTDFYRLLFPLLCIEHLCYYCERLRYGVADEL